MFEIVSGQPLEPFFSQWLNRSGAPAIAIESASAAASDAGYALTIALQQSAPAYQLHVPVAVETAQGMQTHVLDLQQERQTFTLALTTKPQSVALDPDLRLFRRLAPGEAPPILREVMVNSATQTILLSAQAEVRSIAAALAGKLQDRTPHIAATSDLPPATPALIVGLQPEIDAWLAARQLPSAPGEIGNKGTAQVWTLAQDGGASIAIIAAKDAAALEVLIRPLPHYGRQSYLAFDGRQVIEKGTWPMQAQKLAIE